MAYFHSRFFGSRYFGSQFFGATADAVATDVYAWFPGDRIQTGRRYEDIEEEQPKPKPKPKKKKKPKPPAPVMQVVEAPPAIVTPVVSPVAPVQPFVPVQVPAPRRLRVLPQPIEAGVTRSVVAIPAQVPTWVHYPPLDAAQDEEDVAILLALINED